MHPEQLPTIQGEILEFWIAPAWRRRRLGQALATRSLRQLPREAGLQCYAENDPALAFWRHFLCCCLAAGWVSSTWSERFALRP